jgi:hypothetical protein
MKARSLPVATGTPGYNAQEETQSNSQRPRPRKLMIDELNPNRKSPEVQEIPKTVQKTRPSTQTTVTSANRPVRTTRNSQPVHAVDLEENPTREEPIKYSVAHGLGATWSK